LLLLQLLKLLFFNVLIACSYDQDDQDRDNDGDSFNQTMETVLDVATDETDNCSHGQDLHHLVIEWLNKQSAQTLRLALFFPVVTVLGDTLLLIV